MHGCKRNIRSSLPLIGSWLLLAIAGCRLVEQHQNKKVVYDLAESQARSAKLVEKGIHYYQKNFVEKAGELFNQAIEADRTNGAAYNNLGLVFFYQHDLQEAARAFEAAAEYLPGDPAPLNNLGLILDSAARPMDALELYEQAHQLEPRNAEYLGNLVRAKVRLKMIDDELLSQIHSLLLFDKRPEWQDWAREQIGLFHNPYLDQGPPKPKGDPLNELTGDGEGSGQSGSKVLFDSKTGKPPASNNKPSPPAPTPTPSLPQGMSPSSLPSATSRESSRRRGSERDEAVSPVPQIPGQLPFELPNDSLAMPAEESINVPPRLEELPSIELPTEPLESGSSLPPNFEFLERLE